jgi:hypothetical protein
LKFFTDNAMKSLLLLLALLTGLAYSQPIPPPTPGAATCGSTDKTICYNNAGAFAGDANLTWDATTGLAALKPVGFGTAAPTTWDSLVGNNIATLAGMASNIAAGKSQNLMFRSAGAGGTDASHITAVASRGTLAAPTVVDDGDVILDQRYYAYNGTSFGEVAAIAMAALGTGMGAGKSGEIYLQALNQTGSGSAGTYLDLYANPDIGQFAQLQSDFIILKGLSGAEVDFDNTSGLVSTRKVTAPLYATTTNCADPAGAAACGAAPAGAFVVDAASTATVVSTTAVTATSRIFVQEDSSLATELGVTCNTQSSLTLGAGRVTARTAGTSFTFTLEAGPTTNPACFSYFIVN